MRRVYLAGPPYADEYRRRAADLVQARGFEPVDPMRRDFRGRTTGREAEIVEGDLAEIESCDVVLAAFTAPDEGTAMEAWHAHALKPGPRKGVSHQDAETGGRRYRPLSARARSLWCAIPWPL